MQIPEWITALVWNPEPTPVLACPLLFCEDIFRFWGYVVHVQLCSGCSAIPIPGVCANSRNNNQTMSLGLWLKEILGAGSSLLYLLILQCKHICCKTDGPFPPAFSNGCLIREGIKKILKSLNKVSRAWPRAALHKGQDYGTQRAVLPGSSQATLNRSFSSVLIILHKRG